VRAKWTVASPFKGASRIASRLLGGGSMKRRERIIPKPVIDAGLRAAISWLFKNIFSTDKMVNGICRHVEIFDYSLNQRMAAVLGTVEQQANMTL